MRARPIKFEDDGQVYAICLGFYVVGDHVCALVELEHGGIDAVIAADCWFIDIGGDEAPIDWQIARLRLLGAMM